MIGQGSQWVAGTRPLYWLFGTHRASQTGGLGNRPKRPWIPSRRLALQSVRQWCSLDGPRPRVTTSRYEVHYRLIPNLGCQHPINTCIVLAKSPQPLRNQQVYRYFSFSRGSWWG